MKAGPKGCYELMNGTLNTGLLTGIGALDNAEIDGIRLKISWDFVETSPGTFDWTNLDDAISKVLAKGKKCGIGFGMGIGNPSWLFDSTLPTPAQAYTILGGDDIGLVIHQPGDPIYLQRLTSFVQAAAAKYDANTTVSYVVIEGNSRHAEWNIASNAADTAALGSTQALVNIWIQDTKDFIDAYMNAFTNTVGIITLQKPFVNSMGWPAMYTASNYGITRWNDHLGLMWSGLNANSNTNTESVNQIALNYATNPTWSQMVSGGGGANGTPQSEGLDQSLRSAVNLHARGVEIYKSDCDDNSLYSYTAPGGSVWQGNNVSGTPAGIAPRRTEMLAIPDPVPPGIRRGHGRGRR